MQLGNIHIGVTNRAVYLTNTTIQKSTRLTKRKLELLIEMLEAE